MPLTEWLGVASYPNKINVFAVPDYDQLPTIVNRLIVSVINGHSLTHYSTLIILPDTSRYKKPVSAQTISGSSFIEYLIVIKYSMKP